MKTLDMYTAIDVSYMLIKHISHYIEEPSKIFFSITIYISKENILGMIVRKDGG